MDNQTDKLPPLKHNSRIAFDSLASRIVAWFERELSDEKQRLESNYNDDLNRQAELATLLERVIATPADQPLPAALRAEIQVAVKSFSHAANESLGIHGSLWGQQVI